MDKVTTVGIDLAKRVFSLHGVESSGRVVLRKTVHRDRLVETVSGLAPCLIGMEACSGAHGEGRGEAPLPTVGGNAWLGGVATALENFESKNRVENVCFECSTSLRNAIVAKRRKA